MTKKKRLKQHNQRKKPQLNPAISKQSSLKFFNWIIRVWKFLTVIAGFGAMVLAYSVLIPDIEVSTYTTLNSKQPLETRFAVTSNSILPIYNIHYDCEFIKRGLPPYKNINYRRIGISLESELFLRTSFTMYCGIPAIDSFDSLNEGILNLFVYFKKPLNSTETEKDFGFLLKRDNEGKVQWLPMGPATSKPNHD